MPWIEYHSTLKNHPKVRAICVELGIKKTEALGILGCLWTWALDYAEDGDLSKYPPEIVEEGCEWEGEKGRLFESLKGKFIDQDLKIHDWLDFAGKYLHAKYHSSNPKKLKQIWKGYGYIYGKGKGLGGKYKGQTKSGLKDKLRSPKGQTKDSNRTVPDLTNRSVAVKQKETDYGRVSAAAPAAVSVLTGYGMGRDQASGLIKDYGLEAVNKALAKCVKQGSKVRNPGGWVTRTLRREWGDRRHQRKAEAPKGLEAIRAEVDKIPQELRPRLRLEARRALGQFACSSLGVVEMKMLELYRAMEGAEKKKARASP